MLYHKNETQQDLAHHAALTRRHDGYGRNVSDHKRK